MKKAAILVLLGLAVLSLVVVGRALPGASTPAPLVSAIEVEVNGPESLARFSKALTYETISHDPDSGVALDAAAFLDFRRFIEASYPRVHAALERDIVSDYTLFYSWRGRKPELDPILLMGHYDVVPADSTTLDQWTHLPFSGEIADGYLWGRGAIDNKINVIGLLEAAELLLARGYSPERTLYFSFGHDEEIGGAEGAAKVAERIRSRGESLALVVDEGGAILDGLLPGMQAPLAVIGVAEKGYLSLRLEVTAPGGHSSAPPDHTAVGVLATAIHRLERNQLASHFEGHLRETLSAAAPHMGFGYRIALQNQWLFGPVIEAALLRRPQIAPMLRTTTAPTIFTAGVKDNVLPSSATATVNFRLFPGDSVEEVIEHVRRVVANDQIELTPTGLVMEASEVSSIETPAGELLANSIRQSFGGIGVVPFLIPGGTDARYFRSLSQGTFGFTPMLLDADDMRRAHGINERISTESYLEGIRFYAQLVSNAGGPGD